MPVRTTLGPRKKPSQDRSRDTVLAILEATAHILRTEGYEAASTNRVAAAAGVSVGSLYQYFPNKEALIAALLFEHGQKLMALFEAAAIALADSPLPVATRLLVRTVFEAHRVDPKLHRVLLAQIPYGATAHKKDELAHRTQGLLLAYLRHHAAELRPTEERLEVAAFLAAQALEGVAHGAVLQRQELLNNDDLVEETTQMLLRYLVKAVS